MTGTWKLRLDNSSVFSDFFGLRADVTLEKETPEFRKVQVRAEVKLSNFVEDDFFEFWLNSVAILSEFCFEKIFTIICWETYSLRTENLKIIALIYGRFDLRAFCVELTLRFWQTFRILRAESAFRQSWKRQAESLFEANLRHSAESKTKENKLYDKTPNP